MMESDSTDGSLAASFRTAGAETDEGGGVNKCIKAAGMETVRAREVALLNCRGSSEEHPEATSRKTLELHDGKEGLEAGLGVCFSD